LRAPQRQILLLRGVNVGGRNRVAMAELSRLLEARGMRDVRTYLQSGNVVVLSDSPAGELVEVCRRALAHGFGLDVDVLVRSRDELAAVIARNPLALVALEPKRYLVSFLREQLDAHTLSELQALAAGGEQLVASGRELYAWLPGGVARSRLWAALASPELPTPATARNWSTVTKLLAIAGA
jgi:uncharacterized protein (DUF1697 family)